MKLIELIPGTKLIEEEALEKRAIVQEGTHIEMLEYDLFNFGASITLPWAEMVDRWLNKGATLDLYFQFIHQQSEEEIQRLKRNHERNLTLYPLSPYSEEIKLTLDLKDCQTFHFTLFHNPDQMWLEDYHPPEKSEMFNCKFIRNATKDRRFKDLHEILEAVKEYTTPI